MLRFERHPLNPLFGPISTHSWESRFVFNPAVVFDGNLFHMLYRAQGEDMVSRMGYAISMDGVHFNRLEKPVFCPGHPSELYGVEDPRLTFIEGRYYMTYTAYSPVNVKVALASTLDFFHWQRHGIILPHDPDKDAMLFPEKIGGRYALLHRVPPDIWLSFSEDLLHWDAGKPIAGPRPKSWENLKIGGGGPPLKTPFGWLLLYHGVQDEPVASRPSYRLGLMLLDQEDPSKVLRRTLQPVFEPEEEWEIYGGVPNVVFSDAMIEVGDEYWMYYGAADNFIALATLSKEKVWAWCKGEE